MIRRQVLALFALVPAVVAPALFAVHPWQPAPQQSGSSGNGLVTLYARDGLLSSVNFRSGGAGGSIVDGEIDLNGAHLAFDVFEPGMLSFGFSALERVNVMDLGPQFVEPLRRRQDLAPKLDVSLFHTLFLDRSRFSYIGTGGTLERIAAAEEIFQPLPRQGVYHVAPIMGNTYVLRANGRDSSRGNELIVKFLVIDVQEGRSVTLRWSRL